MSNPYFPTPQTNTAAINTDVVITLAAISDARRSIETIIWSHDGTPAAATRITVESPSGTVLIDFDVTAGGPGFIPLGKPGARGALGEALLVRMNLSATSNTIGTLSIIEGNA